MMKKETAVLAVIVLIIGILIGVIYANWRKDTGSSSGSLKTPPAGVVNYQQKITMLQDIVTKEPNNRNAWVQLGHNYFDSDQLMEAIDAYQKALDLNGNDADVLTDQGIMYRRVGWYDKAIANFTKASELVPSHQQSLYNLGVVYRYDVKDFPKAIAAWEKMLAANPSSPGADQVRKEINLLKKHVDPSGAK